MKVAIPAEDILAMKADLSIIWSKLCVVRRYPIIVYIVNFNKQQCIRLAM